MIVSVPELQEYMSDVTLTPAQVAAAGYVIAGVQSEIETYLNRPVELAEHTETIVTDWDGYAHLTRTPVASVATVVYNSEPLTYHQLEGSSVYTGIIRAPITVTYTGGFDGTSIPAIKLAVLRVASREMQNRHDDTLSVKDLTNQDVAPLSEGLQEEDKKRIERFRRRVIV